MTRVSSKAIYRGEMCDSARREDLELKEEEFRGTRHDPRAPKQQ